MWRSPWSPRWLRCCRFPDLVQKPEPIADHPPARDLAVLDMKCRGAVVRDRFAGGWKHPGRPSKDAAMGSLPLPVHGNYIAIARHFRDRITSVRKALAQRGDGRRERLA